MSEDAGATAGTETEPVSDEIVDTETEDNPEAQEPGTGEPDLAEQLAHWKAQARKHETRAKENSKAARELEEIKKAGMSDLEKAQADLAEATRERDEARADHSRIMAAAAHDLPVDLIDDLGAGTDDEISERAERWSRVIEEEVQKRVDSILGQGNRNGAGTAARPVESMRMGSAPASSETPQTPDEWFRRLLENR